MNMVITDRSFLKKHVDLILCSNSMTLIQRKIFNLLLYNASPDLMEKSEFSLPVKEICSSIGYTSRNYLPLVDAIEGIGILAIKWRVIDSKTKLEDIISDTIAVMSRVRIQDGICYYKYNEDIRHKLAHPSIYGKINLVFQSRISSTFGLVLYELCEKYKNIKMSPWISMSELRILMGVKEKGYKLFADFERYVLRKATEEVNSKTNFTVEYDKKREGRGVKHIKFFINQEQAVKQLKSKGESNQSCEASNEILNELIKDLGVKEKVAINICYENKLEYIQEKISYTKEGLKNGNIKNAGAFIVQAIKEDYKASKSSADFIREQVNVKINNQKEKTSETDKELNYKNEYCKYLHNKVEEYLRSFSDDSSMYARIEDNFVQYLEDNNDILYIKNFKKEGVNNRIVRPKFNRYVAEAWLRGEVYKEEVYIKKLKQGAIKAIKKEVVI